MSKEIKMFAKGMRRRQTKHEQLLWAQLRRKKLGFMFHRQSVLRGYIVDFYCPAAKLAIEVDGLGHSAAKDEIRDRRILKLGISVIRFSNRDVENSIGEVIRKIRVACNLPSFPIFPQASEQSQVVIRDPSDCCDESGGNVQKSPIPINLNGKRRTDRCGFFVDGVENCTRQVYADEEVAQDTASALKRFGVIATPSKCRLCGKIHLDGLR